MSCKINRWKGASAPGGSSQPPKTPAANELEKRLAEMAKERTRQDAMWTETEPSTQSSVQPFSNSYNTALIYMPQNRDVQRK